MNGLAHAELVCPDPEVQPLLTDYCFGNATESVCDRVQQHLLECDRCWSEVRQLAAATEQLRSGNQLTWPAMTPETVGLFGLSGQSKSFLAGHRLYTSVVAGLFAMLFAAGLFNEVGYLFDRYGFLALRLAPFLMVWAFGSLSLSFAVVVRSVRRSRFFGLPQAALLLTGVTALMLGGVVPWLPAELTAPGAIRTGTVQSGFVKDVLLYLLPLALLIILPTFHIVVTLQTELAAGRHDLILKLLADDGHAIAPRGCVYVRPWVFGLALIPAALWAIGSTFYFLGQLSPGPYLGLFTIFLVIRLFLWFAIAIVALVWYRHCLNVLKWECLAVRQLVSR